MASRSTASTKSGASTKETDPAAKPELELVTETSGADILSTELKKQELFQLVAERADLNRNKVKPVVEAMLEVLGEALAEGRELNLKPFGKVKINRQKDVGNARVTVAKIRQAKSDSPADGT
ncbi:HU family DNA-binding protein [Roseovarius confluentis]|uniref:HU family DNA-binding protein n=1 Tax=Roseovarius confluentis TaxID=1852027 RepID=UPI0014741B4D|nr:HU family DNA-binding protein [Roseovarius confluentis]